MTESTPCGDRKQGWPSLLCDRPRDHPGPHSSGSLVQWNREILHQADPPPDPTLEAIRVRDQLAAARNYLRGARMVADNYRGVPSWAHPGDMEAEFLRIERSVALSRIRQWEPLVARLEETARFLGVE